MPVTADPKTRAMPTMKATMNQGFEVMALTLQPRPRRPAWPTGGRPPGGV
jgi:hypothetical protein